MPNVVGKSETAAELKLVGRGIKAKVLEVNSTTKVGNVISSDPKFGATITKGEKVTITVSLGLKAIAVTIPSVTNMSIASAEVELTSNMYKLNYTVKFIDQAPPGVPPTANWVLAQSPTAGKTGHQGDYVILDELNPASQLGVPPLSGLSTNEAVAKLVAAGLAVGPTTTSACSNTVGIGLVEASLPAQGALVNPGTQVDLITSTGYCNVLVPSVLQETQAEATATLKGKNLTVNVAPTDPSTCSPSDVGRVTNETNAQGVPVIGNYVKFNASIIISVCESSTEVPPTTTTTTIP
jgi:serine/threonine-protein kinase